MTNFDISDSLKQHHLFDLNIYDLLETFKLVFDKEKQELLRRFINRLDALYGEPQFSPTIFNISDIIVYKYFNNKLSFADKCFVKQNKHKEYPFWKKIKELENKT